MDTTYCTIPYLIQKKCGDGVKFDRVPFGDHVGNQKHANWLFLSCVPGQAADVYLRVCSPDRLVWHSLFSPRLPWKICCASLSKSGAKLSGRCFRRQLRPQHAILHYVVHVFAGMYAPSSSCHRKGNKDWKQSDVGRPITTPSSLFTRYPTPT